MKKATVSISLNEKPSLNSRKIFKKRQKSVKNEIFFPSVRMENEIFNTCMTETFDPILPGREFKMKSQTKVEKKIPKIDVGNNLQYILPVRDKRLKKFSRHEISETVQTSMRQKISRRRHFRDEINKPISLTPTLIFRSPESYQKYSRKSKKLRENIDLLSIHQASLYCKLR